jgi:hypothetical protein
MSRLPNRLYNLLPVIYRQRDELIGQPLEALLAVIEKEFNLLESDMAAAYDNWFIETCDAWVIPYLADLVGLDEPALFEGPLLGQRRLVANHIAYQRRKGLASILAHVARDVSGWYVHVTDLSQRVAQTQHMKNIKPSLGKMLDLRQGEGLALLGTAFDRAARTLDVRRVDADTQSGSLPGLVSPNALALYLWRLQSYPIRQARAGVPGRIRQKKETQQFTFDPLGRSLPLFIQPEAIENLSEPMRPSHFPQPLTRAMLQIDLNEACPETMQQGFLFDDEQTSSRYYGPQKEIAIWIDGSLVPAEKIYCARIGTRKASEWITFLHDLNKTAVVDPETGRFFLAEPADPEKVTVNYTYGFSDDRGSGPFWHDMPDPADQTLRQEAKRIDVIKSGFDSHPSETGGTVSSLEEALKCWQDLCDKAGTGTPPKETPPEGKPPRMIIRFLDSGTYLLPGPLQPDLPSGSFLSIEAAAGERPTIVARKGFWKAERATETKTVVFDRRFRLQGLLVCGPVALPGMWGGRLDFRISGCTFVDPLDLYLSETVQFDLAVSASLMESLFLSQILEDKPNVVRKGSLSIEDTIVRQDVKIISNPVHESVLSASIQRSTIFGHTTLSNVSAIKDAILLGGLEIENMESDQVLVQYSYVDGTNLSKKNLAYCITGSQKKPQFTSTHPDHPGYAQLRDACPKEIRYGASNGAEMGVFNARQANRRAANLKHMLADYLPLGQKIGLFEIS